MKWLFILVATVADSSYLTFSDLVGTTVKNTALAVMILNVTAFSLALMVFIVGGGQYQ